MASLLGHTSVNTTSAGLHLGDPTAEAPYKACKVIPFTSVVCSTEVQPDLPPLINIPAVMSSSALEAACLSRLMSSKGVLLMNTTCIR